MENDKPAGQEAILIAVRGTTVSVWTKQGLRPVQPGSYIKAEVVDQRVAHYWQSELERNQDEMNSKPEMRHQFIVLPLER